MIGAAFALPPPRAVPLPTNAIAVTLAFEPPAPAIPPPASAPSPTSETLPPEVVASPPENPPAAASEVPEPPPPEPPPPEPSAAALPEPAPPSRAEPLVQTRRPPPRTRPPPEMPSATTIAPTIADGQPQRQSSPAPAVDQQAFAPLIPPRPVSGLASNRKPDYPLAARSRRQEGRVLLRVHVSAAGAAGSVEIVSSSGHPILDQAARAAVQAWRFVPATRAGVAVAAQADVPIEFRMDD